VHNISQFQSHIAKLKAQYGDAVSVSKSSSKSSNKSRKRKRKRQPNDDDEDFDPMQITSEALVDEDFEFSPSSATGASASGEPITPVSATVMTPPSAITLDGERSAISGGGADQGGAAGSAGGASTLTSRGSKKNSRKKRAKSATTKKNSKKKRKKGKYKSGDDDEDVMLDVDSNILPREESDDEVGYGLQGKDISQPHNQFWRMIDEYFQPVHNDPEKLNLLKPVDIENDEDLNQIPELGQHYLQKWSEEKMQDGAENAARANRTATFSDSIPSVDLDIASDFFDTNSITVRLLQSMIEEQDVLNVGRKSKKGRPKLTRNSRQQQQDNQNQYREQILQSGDVQRGISASTDDYTTTMMSQIDSRVTQELQSLGLFSIPSESAAEQVPDEDDEVLAEIKRLQRELTEQISLSNQFRRKIFDNVMARRDDEETLVRRRREDKRIIREFERRVFNPRVRV